MCWRPYAEVAEVLAALRERGVRTAICSNWDWDLAEAVEEAGLSGTVDVVVSSAWAGARKPHPRIFEHTLDRARRRGGATSLFVGDTWGPDVVGPLAMGMTPVYLRRDGHWPDDTAPSEPGVEGVTDRARPAHPARASCEATTRPRTRRDHHPAPLPTVPATPDLDAGALVARLRSDVRVGRTRPLEWRREQLKRMKALLVEREQDLLDALAADLGKPQTRGVGDRHRRS